MATLVGTRTRWIPGAVLCCVFLGLSGARAEVAACGNEDMPTLYVIAEIIDETDPVDAVWQTYHAHSPGRVVLNSDGFDNEDGKPTCLVTPLSNLPIVAWSRNSPQGYDVVVTHFTAGAWSEPLPLASSPADELDPFLLLDPQDGTVHVFYWIHDASPRVMHRQAPADLSSWSLPEQVSQPGEIASRPAAVFHAGVLTVVYELHELGFESTPRQIVFASSNGFGFDFSTVGFTTYAGNNWPQVHSRKGKLWVEWIDAENAMSWTRRSASGEWDPIQLEAFAGIEDRDYHVRARVKMLALD